MLKICILSVFILLLSCTKKSVVQDDSRAIVGSVVDGDKKPIKDAYVYLDDEHKAKTDSDGKYTLPYPNEDRNEVILFASKMSLQGSVKLTLKAEDGIQEAPVIICVKDKEFVDGVRLSISDKVVNRKDKTVSMKVTPIFSDNHTTIRDYIWEYKGKYDTTKENKNSYTLKKLPDNSTHTVYARLNTGNSTHKRTFRIIKKDKSISVFIAIDNSGSINGFTGIGSSHITSDIEGVRFDLAKRLIDRIYKESPFSTVSLAVYAKHLRFDRDDDSVFVPVKMDNEDRGGYIPQIKLNEEYYGKTGYEILTDYLKFSIVKGNSSNVNRDYAQLLYGPTNMNYRDSSRTNLLPVQKAIRDDFTNSSDKKEKHIVVLFTDGHSDEPESIEAQGIPTTFVVYFNERLSSMPVMLRRMIENTQNNGYSKYNRGSRGIHVQTEGKDAVLELFDDKIIDLLK